MLLGDCRRFDLLIARHIYIYIYICSCIYIYIFVYIYIDIYVYILSVLFLLLYIYHFLKVNILMSITANWRLIGIHRYKDFRRAFRNVFRKHFCKTCLAKPSQSDVCTFCRFYTIVTHIQPLLRRATTLLCESTSITPTVHDAETRVHAMCLRGAKTS